MRRRVVFVLIPLMSLVALAAALHAVHAAAAVRPGGAMPFTVSTSAFKPGESIPARHTCDGADVSPALSWTAPPAGTKSLALICDDPDAPGGLWTHWLIWNLAPDRRDLPEGLAKTAAGPEALRQGTNDFGRPGYGGPCPPRGPAHRYSFRLLALEAPLDLPAGANRPAFDAALATRKILATAEIMGRYSRAR